MSRLYRSRGARSSGRQWDFAERPAPSPPPRLWHALRRSGQKPHSQGENRPSPKPGVESSSLSGPVPHGRKESRYPCGIPTSPVPQLDCRSQPPKTARIGVRLRAPGGSAAQGTRRAVRAVSARLLAAFPAVASDFLASGTFGRSGRWAGLESDSLRGETGEHRAPPFPVLPSLS